MRQTEKQSFLRALDGDACNTSDKTTPGSFNHDVTHRMRLDVGNAKFRPQVIRSGTDWVLASRLHLICAFACTAINYLEVMTSNDDSQKFP